MSVVLNEHEWAEKMIQSRSLGKRPFETLCMVARYYIDGGFSKKALKNMLDGFILQCDPTASLTKWADAEEYAMARACKYKAVMIDSIDITDKEMITIKSIEGRQAQRLAFTLLCLSKYWDVVTDSDKHWVNTKDSEIMSLANINTSIKRQSEMFRQLKSAGLVNFSKMVDNTNVQVCFRENGETVMSITDFRNVGYQYMKYCGEPYFECQCCGITVRKSDSGKGRPQKYCKDCAAGVKIQQSVSSVTRIRKCNRKNT